MSFRRVGWLIAVGVAAWLELSCGQVYRPVVIPTGVVPPNPANFHAVFGISTNAPFNPGTALQIDVSGDSDIGSANVGVFPTHATILPNNSRVFVASAGSLSAGQSDVVTAFTPASQSTTATGLGNSTVFPLAPGSLPVFVHTTQTNAVYVANYGTNTVSSLNTASNVVSLTTPVGSHPVALAETPDALNLYVVNQGDGTLTDLSPVDLSPVQNVPATIAVGSTPVWAVARVDNRRVYVVTQGGGQLVPIDTATNTVLPSQTPLTVGAGANFVLYDAHLNRLYVTNPTNATVYVFSTTGGVDLGGTPNDTPTLLGTISMTAGSNPPCPSGCSPVSVAALPDGSRFYVASYQSVSPCPDVNVGGGACIIPMLTVFDAPSLTVKPITGSLLAPAPSLSLLTPPQFAATQYGLPPVPACVTPATYAPGATRFRMFTTAAADSSHVYVSICDGGAIADVNTTTSTLATGGTNSVDTLVTTLVAPSAACPTTCSVVAAITAFSITSNVITFTAANNFFPGEKVSISGLTSEVGLLVNGATLTVLATGLSSSQFECSFSNSNITASVPLTSDSGSAVPATPPQTPVFLLTGQ